MLLVTLTVRTQNCYITNFAVHPLVGSLRNAVYSFQLSQPWMWRNMFVSTISDCCKKVQISSSQIQAHSMWLLLHWMWLPIIIVVFVCIHTHTHVYIYIYLYTLTYICDLDDYAHTSSYSESKSSSPLAWKLVMHSPAAGVNRDL